MRFAGKHTCTHREKGGKWRTESPPPNLQAYPSSHIALSPFNKVAGVHTQKKTQRYTHTHGQRREPFKSLVVLFSFQGQKYSTRIYQVLSSILRRWKYKIDFHLQILRFIKFQIQQKEYQDIFSSIWLDFISRRRNQNRNGVAQCAYEIRVWVRDFLGLKFVRGLIGGSCSYLLMFIASLPDFSWFNQL